MRKREKLGTLLHVRVRGWLSIVSSNREPATVLIGSRSSFSTLTDYLNDTLRWKDNSKVIGSYSLVKNNYLPSNSWTSDGYIFQSYENVSTLRQHSFFKHKDRF